MTQSILRNPEHEWKLHELFDVLAFNLRRLESHFRQRRSDRRAEIVMSYFSTLKLLISGIPSASTTICTSTLPSVLLARNSGDRWDL